MNSFGDLSICNTNCKLDNTNDAINTFFYTPVTASLSYTFQDKQNELEYEINTLKEMLKLKTYEVVKCPCCGASSIKNSRCEYCGSYFI